VKLAEDPVEAVLGVVEDAPVVAGEVPAALVLPFPVDGRLEEGRHLRQVVLRVDDRLVRVGGAVRVPRRSARHSFQMETELVQRRHAVSEPQICLQTHSQIVASLYTIALLQGETIKTKSLATRTQKRRQIFHKV